jgi:hypothetical protein
MTRFLEAPSEEAAAFVLLKLPGARPYVSRGYGRNLPVTELDEWARNWWYRFHADDMYALDLPYVGGMMGAGPVTVPLATLSFVTAEQKTKATMEMKQLKANGERGLNWIAVRVARAIRREPRMPGAADALFAIIESCAVTPWAFPPDADQPQTGRDAAYRLFTTRFRLTPQFREFQRREFYRCAPEQ